MIRQSVEKDRHRIVSILGAAGHGKSTVLGELYDLLVEQDLEAWVAIVDCGALDLSQDGDLGMAFGQAVLGESTSLVATAGRLNAASDSGILLIDTLDLLLGSGTVPRIQRLLLDLTERRVTCVVSCRDYDYEVHVEPAGRRLPLIYKHIDRYTLPPFEPRESAAAARAFVRRHAGLGDGEAGRPRLPSACPCGRARDRGSRRAKHRGLTTRRRRRDSHCDSSRGGSQPP